MPQGRTFWLTVIVPFGLGYLVTKAFQVINAVMAVPMMRDLSLSNAQIGFVTALFGLGAALAQIPVGICLDHFGPRRTQVAFFCLAAAGIVLFGLADGMVTLSIGRALLGIGAAGGLLAALKAIADIVEKDRVPFYNGIILGIGGLGALVATAPAKLFEIEFGWRALCFALGGATLVIALSIVLLGRDAPAAAADRISLRERAAGVATIYRSRFFWRLAPLIVTGVGGFIAVQGLWLGSWLQHVIGVSPLISADYLFLVALAMSAGMLSGGLFARFAEIIGVSAITVVGLGVGIHILAEIAIVLGFAPGNRMIWFVYAYFGQAIFVSYAVLAQWFGPGQAGRATTAANMLNFLFVFAVQYGIGEVVHWWPGDVTDPFGGSIDGYHVAFSGLIVLEVAALAWFVLESVRARGDKVAAHA